MKIKDKQNNIKNMICLHKNSILVTKVIVLCVICYTLTIILIGWNRVPRFQHYLYLTHPYSKSADIRHHFVEANVELVFTNGFDILQEQTKLQLADKYSFIIHDKPKRQDVSPPQYSKNDSIMRFISRNHEGMIPMKDGALLYLQGQSISRGLDICNLYGVIHYASLSSLPFTFHPEVRTCNNGIAFIKNEPLENDTSNGLWWEESILYDRMKILRDLERDFEGRDLMFNYPDGGMSFQTAYIGGSYGSRVTSVSINYDPEGLLKRYFRIFLAPFDVTKAQFDCVVFSQEIDSLNVSICFKEGVEFSGLGNIEPTIIDMHHLVFSDIGRIKSQEFRKAIHRASLKLNFLYGDVIQQKADSGFSLFVNYLSYRNIQWLRLFILTTILSYFYFNLVRKIYRMIVNILKMR